jgi:very-short-patch-repair endonuclease
MKKCIICKKEFDSSDGRVKMCSNECKEKYKKTYADRRRENSLSGIENVDYLICKWCGQRVTRIYGQHIKFSHPGKTIENYKKEFLLSSICTEKDSKNVSISSGKHMKEEKYRKMFSEMVKGDKNPVHHSNMSEQKRKELSPFSQEFYKKRGLFEADYKKFLISVKNREFDTTLEYYLKRGFSKDEARDKLKERQTTFSKDICIKKYGEEKGIERWKERQKKWLLNYKKSNYSKISQILFKSIHGRIAEDFNQIYYATILNNNINNEFKLDLSEKVISPDFIILDNKKIIEFDGVYWHKNTPENMKRERERDRLIIDNGYSILHIWENNYYSNPEKELQKCLDFIYEKTA